MNLRVGEVHNFGKHHKMDGLKPVGEDRQAARQVRKIFIPFDVKDDSTHTDIAQWQLRKLRNSDIDVYSDDDENFNQHHHSLKSPLPPRPKQQRLQLC